MNTLLITVALCTLAIYIFLIAMMRVFGRRTMAQLNPVDLLIVIMLGSSVETAMVHGSTSLRVGFVSATVLLASNWLMNQIFLRSKKLRHFVAGGPVILIHNGNFVDPNIRRMGLTQDDVRAALRQRETGDASEVRIAVLEPDGTINVVMKADHPK